MPKPVLPYLETMASYACNLSCVGCTNYSDTSFKGNVTWSQCQTWLEEWLNIIDITEFGIIGGEPLANPTIDEWIIGSKKLFPNSQIRFTTNGMLLYKKLELIDLMHDLGNFIFKITVHKKDSVLEETIKKIFTKFNFEPVTEYGILRYKTSNNFRFQINRPTKFIKTYKNNYNNMLPHKSNPKEAFDICVQQNCPLLYKGKIYKCSSIGILDDVLKKFNRDKTIEWEPYLNYKGISIDSSLNDITAFINRFGKPENICSMCPTINDTDSIIDHYSNVRKKYAGT